MPIPTTRGELRQQPATRSNKDVFISCSSDVLPEIREYERTSTTVINACLGPILEHYFSSLVRHLKDIGVTAPLQVMKSDGGIMTAAAATQRPAHLVESGPAAGVIGAARVTADDGSAISLDMGGTTAKAAIVEHGEMTTTGDYEVGAGINLSSRLIMGGGHALKLPVVDLSEIGAGGGSLVKVDKGGLLQVGPESAGALPGPVAYDRGGTAPTFTDAMVVLGYLNPEYLVGGALRLNSKAANEALLEQIAGPLNRDVLDVAYGIYRIAAGRMVRAVKAVSTYRGRDPRDFDLFAFGGNGPVAAAEIASQLNMSRIVVPLNPGVFSAFGLLLSDMRNEVSQAFLGRVEDLDQNEMETIYARLEAEARSVLKADKPVEVDRLIDLRYTEQAHELTIPYVDDLRDLATNFSEEHARTYGHEASIESVECVALRVAARIPVEGVQTYDLLASLRDSDRPPGRRDAYFGAARLETPVVTRWDVLQAPRPGPLIVEEYDSTCVVPPGWHARVDTRGNLELTRDHEVEH